MWKQVESLSYGTLGAGRIHHQDINIFKNSANQVMKAHYKVQKENLSENYCTLYAIPCVNIL